MSANGHEDANLSGADRPWPEPFVTGDAAAPSRADLGPFAFSSAQCLKRDGGRGKQRAPPDCVDD
jgi:hypothetical protein